MGRLYYEKHSDPNLATAAAAPPPGINDYLAKVASLVPSEVIAGYLTMIGFAGSVKNVQTQNVITWIIFAAGLILTPLYFNRVADPGKPKRNHIILSTIAFIVWAYVISGEQLLATIAPGLFEQAIASILLVLFSLVSAIIPLNK